MERHRSSVVWYETSGECGFVNPTSRIRESYPPSPWPGRRRTALLLLRHIPYHYGKFADQTHTLCQQVTQRDWASLVSSFPALTSVSHCPVMQERGQECCSDGRSLHFGSIRSGGHVRKQPPTYFGWWDLTSFMMFLLLYFWSVNSSAHMPSGVLVNI